MPTNTPTPTPPPTLTVGWSGDDGVGSGTAGYDLDVSADGGDWIPWLAQTTQTNATYHGEVGHSYTFRLSATGNVSNAASAEAGASTRHVPSTTTSAASAYSPRSEAEWEWRCARRRARSIGCTPTI